MSRNTEGTEKLTLKERLTIGNAQKIYEQVRVSFKNSVYLKIYLSEISEIDLAFLQILYSLLATAHRLGKKISVFIDDPTAIWDLIVKAGFESHFSINPDLPGTDFQIEGIF
jgi:anti-anti-sigma regulatory factor